VRKRQRAITAYKHLDLLLAQFKTCWNVNDYNYVLPDSSISATEVANITKWPADKGPDQDSFKITLTDDKAEADVFFPPADPLLLHNLNFLKDFEVENEGKETAHLQLNTNVSSSAFVQQLGHLADQLELANSVIDSLIHTTSDRLERGLFPMLIFPINNWLPAWFPDPLPTVPTVATATTKQGMSTSTVSTSTKAVTPAATHPDELPPSTIRRRLTRYLLQLPTTTIKVHANCDPVTGLESMTDHCVLNILTLMPKNTDIDIYTQQVFTPHPVPKYKPADTTWQIVDVSNLPTVYQLTWTKQYFMTLHPLKCFPAVPNWKCTVCTSERTLIYITDPCVMSILDMHITDTTCAVVDTTHVDSMQLIHRADATSISDSTTINDTLLTDVILTSNQSPTLVEVCEKTETRTELPPAVIIRATAVCPLHIENGPNVSMITPNFKIQREWSPSTERPSIRFIDRFSNDAMGRMRQHFQDFRFIYVLALIGLILIVAILKFTCFVHDKQGWKLEAGTRYRNEPVSPVPVPVPVLWLQ
jgi:hypothetical protein